MDVHVFETAQGWSGIGWTATGLRRLLLPEPQRVAVETRMLGRYGAGTSLAAKLPSPIMAVIDMIVRYWRGEKVDFGAVDLDLGGIDPFRLAIYAAARRLSFGETTTYGELAAAAGHKSLTRETGQALASNPIPLIVPCHRIVAAGGRLGGFSGSGGVDTKRRMLELEGSWRASPPIAQASFCF